jgi:hypothetical protein
MSATLLLFRSRALWALGLAAAVALGAQQAVAEPPSPFLKFVGNWSGAGQIVGSNGHRESIRCRAEYVEAKGGSALNQGIVCSQRKLQA